MRQPNPFGTCDATPLRGCDTAPQSHFRLSYRSAAMQVMMRAKQQEEERGRLPGYVRRRNLMRASMAPTLEAGVQSPGSPMTPGGRLARPSQGGRLARLSQSLGLRRTSMAAPPQAPMTGDKVVDALRKAQADMHYTPYSRGGGGYASRMRNNLARASMFATPPAAGPRSGVPGRAGALGVIEENQARSEGSRDGNRARARNLGNANHMTIR